MPIINHNPNNCVFVYETFNGCNDKECIHLMEFGGYSEGWIYDMSIQEAEELVKHLRSIIDDCYEKMKGTSS